MSPIILRPSWGFFGVSVCIAFVVGLFVYHCNFRPKPQVIPIAIKPDTDTVYADTVYKYPDETPVGEIPWRIYTSEHGFTLKVGDKEFPGKVTAETQYQGKVAWTYLKFEFPSIEYLVPPPKIKRFFIGMGFLGASKFIEAGMMVSDNVSLSVLGGNDGMENSGFKLGCTLKVWF